MERFKLLKIDQYHNYFETGDETTKSIIYECMLLSIFLALSTGLAFAVGESSGIESKIIIKNVSFIATSPEKENLNGEWVEIANMGSSAESLDKWTLEDRQNHTYTFNNFTLNAGSSVKVHTGSGNDTATDLYWNRNTPVWNNEGDVATLKDASGKVVAKYPEESKGA